MQNGEILHSISKCDEYLPFPSFTDFWFYFRSKIGKEHRAVHTVSDQAKTEAYRTDPNHLSLQQKFPRVKKKKN